MEDLKPWEVAKQQEITTAQSNKNPWDMSEQELSIASQNAGANYSDMGAGEVAIRAVGNLPSSVAGVASDIYEAITSPLDTAHNIVKIGAGALQAALPESFVKAIGEDAASRDMWAAVADFYADRYGSLAGFKEAVATDPASVMADAATVLSAGAGIASKAGLPAKVTSRINTAARIIDPITGTLKAAELVAKGAGKGAEVILGITTGTGQRPISEAYKAGQEGGKKSKQFTEQMRGKADPLDMLNTAKANLNLLREKRSQEYRAKASELGKDQASLSFDGIETSISDIFQGFTYKGKWKTKENQAVFNAVVKEVNIWRGLESVYHTAEGFDVLKQRIYDIAKQPDGSMNPVAGSIYHSVKKTISDQAPLYEEMMGNYSRATEQIIDIEKTLSLKNNASKDTAMRKLQSLMRDNVQTNYGQRTRLGDELEAVGDPFMAGLAGQTMGDMAPRGLARLPAAGMAASASLDPISVASIAPYLAASSPRLVGEATHAAGQLSRGTRGLLGMLPEADYGNIANLLYQSQQPKEQQ